MNKLGILAAIVFVAIVVGCLLPSLIITFGSKKCLERLNLLKQNKTVK